MNRREPGGIAMPGTEQRKTWGHPFTQTWKTRNAQDATFFRGRRRVLGSFAARDTSDDHRNAPSAHVSHIPWQAFHASFRLNRFLATGHVSLSVMHLLFLAIHRRIYLSRFRPPVQFPSNCASPRFRPQTSTNLHASSYSPLDVSSHLSRV